MQYIYIYIYIYRHAHSIVFAVHQAELGHAICGVGIILATKMLLGFGHVGDSQSNQKVSGFTSSRPKWLSLNKAFPKHC